MPDTAVELPFADGTYRFWLPWPQIIELERKTGKSVFAMFAQMGAGLQYGAEQSIVFGGGGGDTNAIDVKETIRLGLIGGNNGMVDGVECKVGPLLAQKLCDDYVYPARPLAESLVTSWQILAAAVTGIDLKKKAVVKPVKRASRSTKE
jgi:Phage tail tube protein, GTA-gp10